MTTFDDREKAYEKKFALDQDLKFKAESRRNKMLAEWAAAKLGIEGAAVEDYVKAVRKADLAEKGDDDVFRKVKQDFADKGVAVEEAEIRKAMGEILAKAVAEVEAASKESGAGGSRADPRHADQAARPCRNDPNRNTPSGQGPWPEAPLIWPASPASTSVDPQASERAWARSILQ